jgi:large subunit ribosomal protein L21
MEYAVIETGGKQYRVEKGMVINVDHVLSNALVDFDKVLLYVNESAVDIGNPYVKGMTVSGKVLGDTRGTKIKVRRFKAKSNYRRVRGYRHLFSQVEIIKISNSPKKTAKPKS